jgi:hypothetical protein
MKTSIVLLCFFAFFICYVNAAQSLRCSRINVLSVEDQEFENSLENVEVFDVETSSFFRKGFSVLKKAVSKGTNLVKKTFRTIGDVAEKTLKTSRKGRKGFLKTNISVKVANLDMVKGTNCADQSVCKFDCSEIFTNCPTSTTEHQFLDLTKRIKESPQENLAYNW